MKLDEFRLQMQSYRQTADEEAMSLKDSYLVLDRLHSLYRKFDFEERTMADQVFAEWVLSEDEKVRFDALAMINEFKIANARPALRELAVRLMLSNLPSAPFELNKVNRILESLVASA